MVAGGKDGEHLAVATTRPETILGDTAVCVHPEVNAQKTPPPYIMTILWGRGRRGGSVYRDMRSH